MTITVATVQSHISVDTRVNGRHIRHLMTEARTAGARVVHFPEGALSGYVKTEIARIRTQDLGRFRLEPPSGAPFMAQ